MLFNKYFVNNLWLNGLLWWFFHIFAWQLCG